MFGFEKSDNNDFKQSISEIVSDILNKNYEQEKANELLDTIINQNKNNK